MQYFGYTLFNLAAAFQVAFLTSVYVTPSTDWFDQSWFSGLIAIVLQFGYVYFFYLYGKLDNVQLPPALTFQKSWIADVDKNRSKWLIYPLIFCVAIFLYWSFDKSILTFLWVMECFAVFILSVILKENHFRYAALGGLAPGLLRLFFYDLAKAGTLTRALVFLGVGAIMLLMNWLYGKYKERFL